MCTSFVCYMTHETVIWNPLLSDVSCNRTARTVMMGEGVGEWIFFSRSAWRASGGHVWLPPKSFVLPPKSIMPLRSRRFSATLYNDMLVLSRKMNLHDTHSLRLHQKKKKSSSVYAVSFHHTDQQPSNLSTASASEAPQTPAWTGVVERFCKENVCKSWRD